MALLTLVRFAARRRGGRMSRARPPRRRRHRARRARRAARAAAVPGLPDFGHPRGPYATAAVQACRRTSARSTPPSAGVTFDVRGIDTLGEELILFCAAIGATRAAARPARRGPRARRRPSATRPSATARPPRCARSAPRSSGRCWCSAPTSLAHGHLTPGRRLPGRRHPGRARCCSCTPPGRSWRSSACGRSTWSRSAEAAAAGAYVLVALGGLVFAAAAMENFLPFGEAGTAALRRDRARCSTSPWASRWPPR